MVIKDSLVLLKTNPKIKKNINLIGVALIVFVILVVLPTCIAFTKFGLLRFFKGGEICLLVPLDFVS